MMNVNQANIERFSGFADCYDKYRPIPPETVIKLINGYLSRKPELVVDIGCGTGLSTFIWINHAGKIIGIEPNSDMLDMAINQQKQKTAQNISFIKGFSNNTGLPSESVDVVTCSQSFHWMEPTSSLSEFSRILKPGGIFASYDCDWPPSIDWLMEDEYSRLLERVKKIADEDIKCDQISVKQWNKNNHLANIRNSGLFRFSREIVFHSHELINSNRMIGIALSQGGIQDLLKTKKVDIEKEIETFVEVVHKQFQDTYREAIFGYRMRLGIK